MKPDPITISLALILTMILNFNAMALIHLGTMRLFMQDMNAPIINVYDIKTESLLKSLNTGEKVSRLVFSSDQTKVYASGIQTLCIIDVNTLDIEVINLFSEDEAYYYIDNIPNRFQNVFPLGISSEGVAVAVVKGTYMVFDARQGGKKVNTYTTEGKIGCFSQGNIYIARQDAVVQVIDPLTGVEKDRFDNVFDANAVSEARKNSSYDDKHINLNLTPYGDHILSNVHLGTSDGTSVAALYDLETRKIIYTERLPQFESLKLYYMIGETSHKLFQRPEPIDPNAKLPEYPLAPTSPDLDKLKVREMQKAADEYKIKANEYAAKMKEVTAKRQEFAKPKNFRARIFSDVACTQEVMHIDGTQYVSMYGDLVFAMKDTACEIYDITTKQLLYTIYLV